MNIQLNKDQKILIESSDDLARIMRQILMRENKLSRGREHTGVKDLPKSSNKEEFMLPFEVAHSMNNSRNPFVRIGNRPEYTKENCDLWEGKTDCSATRFQEIIDKELAWKFLDQSYRYGELMEMTLKSFDRQVGEILY